MRKKLAVLPSESSRLKNIFNLLSFSLSVFHFYICLSVFPSLSLTPFILCFSHQYLPFCIDLFPFSIFIIYLSFFLPIKSYYLSVYLYLSIWSSYVYDCICCLWIVPQSIFLSFTLSIFMSLSSFYLIIFYVFCFCLSISFTPFLGSQGQKFFSQGQFISSLFFTLYVFAQLAVTKDYIKKEIKNFLIYFAN